MIRNDPIVIHGDGETARDFCYVDNVVQANLLAATVEDRAAVNQIYNVALGRRTTLKQLFETIRSSLEAQFPHVRRLSPAHGEARAGDVRLSQADIDKAVRLLGYRPGVGVGEGLAQTIRWYLSDRRERFLQR
jgi:UDP-N-acetylglucosamine 4-epimerase